ncbi:MAG: hypothetical protein GOVbin2371_21 [Prokaryotic dsDNA virus sp.]|nr:hypothetical protein [Salipiger sp.]QDP47436.1 MAG: hypothetical protein GOVbin2371_21 [Prokaryotic dsDNA virus sp.]
MRLRDDQTISQRVAILEEALEKLLDRDSTMHVGPTEVVGELGVYVISRPCECDVVERSGWSLNQLACELEVLLS